MAVERLLAANLFQRHLGAPCGLDYAFALDLHSVDQPVVEFETVFQQLATVIVLTARQDDA
jgi:hypothetical protein